MARPSRASPLLVPGLLLVVAFAPGSAGADQDPRWRWRTLETDNFQVHFPRGLDELARRVATIAEETHARLSVELGWEPRRTTHWVVVDDTDSANGITYVGPLNVIRLFAVPPDDGSTLEDFDDWLELLITHEYTHMLHLDHTRGLPAIVNAVIGEQYHPNHLSPTWLIEGFAVWQESAQGSGGRVRGTMYDMFLRAAVLEGTFLRLDQVSNDTRVFPRGTVPYLYGQGFMAYCARRFGSDLFARLARDGSDELIPYGLNRAFRRATGHSVVALWEDWRRSLEAGYRALAERLGEEGLTEARQLTSMGEWARTPRWSPDGRSISLYSSSEEAPPSVWSVDADSGRRRRLFVTSGSTSVAPSPDGRYLYYSRRDRHWVVYSYDDLFRLDLGTGAEERLTDGARAHDPDVSPDGRRVAYAAWREGASDLWVAGAQGGSARRLLRSEPGEQVYTPRWSPDGRRLAISRWRSGGYRDIELVDVEDGTVTRLTEDRALDTSPCFSPDGRWLVFASDRTGISNLYAFDLEQGDLHQITNVLTGAYMPDLSPDGTQLAFIGYSSRGFDLHTMPFAPAAFRRPQPAVERGPFHRPRPEVRMRERAYEPWATLAPRSWLVGLGQDSFGDALVMTTYGQDATHAHRFAGSLTAGLARGDVGYDLSYELSLFRPNLSLRHSRWVAPRSGYRVDTRSIEYVEESYLLAADLSINLGAGTYSHRLAAGWELRYSRAAGGLPQVDLDPSGRPPRLPVLGLQSGLSLSWRFSNARGAARAISLEQGRTISASLVLAHPALGSDWFQVTFRYRWTEYLSMPWRRHHVLALSLGGGISAGELRTDSFFIGGYPEQDILRAALDQSFFGGNLLRGYPPGVIGGVQYHMLNAEYRMPLWDVERGVYTLPLFLSHLWLAAFCDVGGAFGSTLVAEDLLVGVGAELLARVVVGYQVPLTFRIGYARGLMTGGADQIFTVLGVPF